MSTERITLKSTLFCPFSSTKWRGQTIPPHRLEVKTCKTEAGKSPMLVAVCRKHGARIFIFAPEYVGLILNCETHDKEDEHGAEKQVRRPRTVAGA